MSHMLSPDLFQDRLANSGKYLLLRKLGVGVNRFLHDLLDALGGWNIYLYHQVEKLSHV